MIELMPHQKSTIEYLEEKRATLLAYSLGTGKTAIALGVVDTERKRGRKAVVVCPAYLAQNWAAEVRKFFPHMSTCIAGKGKIDVNADILISSYERLDLVLPSLRVRGVLVCDEAHYLCNKESKRSKKIADACKTMKLHRLLLMTGTPMRNRIPDMYHLLCLLDCVAKYGFRSQFKGYHHFAETFCHKEEKRLRGRNFPIVTYTGCKNLEYLKPWLECWWIKMTLAQVTNLPPITFEDIEVDGVSDAIQKALEVEWKAHENGVIAEKHEFGENVGEHISSAKKMSAVAKAPHTSSFIEGLLDDKEGPIVVFSDHVESCDTICKLLSKYRTATIVGSTLHDKRHRIVEQFQAGQLDVIVGTIGAMSTGITLTKAHISVFNDLAWVPASNEQAFGRIHRISQDMPCTIFTMVGGKIDSMIAKQLVEKSRTIKEVMS